MTDQQSLGTPASWRADPQSPGVWQATVNGAGWTVTMGEFPDEPLYVLDIGGARIGQFDDWPESWLRT